MLNTVSATLATAGTNGTTMASIATPKSASAMRRGRTGDCKSGDVAITCLSLASVLEQGYVEPSRPSRREGQGRPADEDPEPLRLFRLAGHALQLIELEVGGRW